MQDDVAGGILMLGLMMSVGSVVVSLFVAWFVIRSATRADAIVARLEGINRRLDIIGKLAWDEAEATRQRQAGSPPTS